MKTPRLTQTEKNAVRLCADVSAAPVTFAVDWKPSRTWGKTAGVYYRGDRCSLASGCGYDKLSAALADALRWLFPHGTDAHTAIARAQGTGERPTIATLAAHGYTLTPVFQNKTTNAYTISGRDRSQIKDYLAGVYQAVLSEPAPDVTEI